MNPLHARAARKFLQFPVGMGLILFLPAGTLHWCEGWLFCANFLFWSVATTVYLAKKNPELLDRRMNAGPASEKRLAQKIIMTLVMIAFMAMLTVPALDHRFGWSDVPAEIVLLGNLLIAIGFIAVFYVMKANTFAAANIELAKDHQVISSGPYAWVRHPMYAGAIWLLLGIPLALASYWGLLTVIPALFGIAVRLLDEERFLAEKLPGYTEYMKKVRYRLIPGVW